ncbi:hypothetical protein [Aquincola sp. J276]|nr:hypothetical protein [Aquincola sp. J276]
MAVSAEADRHTLQAGLQAWLVTVSAELLRGLYPDDAGALQPPAG